VVRKFHPYFVPGRVSATSNIVSRTWKPGVRDVGIERLDWWLYLGEVNTQLKGFNGQTFMDLFCEV
jgi:hypothetical protein